MHSKLRRSLVALLSVALLVVAPAIHASATTTQTARTCWMPLQPFFDAPVKDWSSVKEVLSHHFFVKYSGVGDLTSLHNQNNRTAKIYYKGRSLNLVPWPQVSRNTWGVSTGLSLQEGPAIMNSSNWRIDWPEGANGIRCVMAR